MSNLVTTHTQQQTFTHRVLWECVLRQIDKAKEKPEGSWYFWLSAMVMGYMVFEAYLNYIGDEVAPEIWIKEREFFSKPEFKGSEGKPRFLLERYGIDYPNKSIRPFASVFALKAIRDEIAHAKPHRVTQSVTHPSDAIAPFTKRWLENRVNETEATRLLDDLNTFIEEIHSAFRNSEDGHLLWSYALKGAMGFGGSSTSLAS